MVRVLSLRLLLMMTRDFNSRSQIFWATGQRVWGMTHAFDNKLCLEM